MTILVTGGAGFIGSHIVDEFMENGEKVRVLDNLSGGTSSNVERWEEAPRFEFIKGDILNQSDIGEALQNCSIVYHIAANPEVRSWKASPLEHFKQNIEGTFNLLEGIRKIGAVNKLVFTSTSTVYGEAKTVPTTEDYAPLKPISNYGASKLAAEALISSYASMYSFQGVIYRMANVVGPRSNHGVVYDFIQKLKANPDELKILGDGSQSKSYLYIDDCVEGMLLGVDNAREDVEILNIGSSDRVDVVTIAKIVVEEMELQEAKFSFTGGVDGGRGWKGDVKLMQLDSSKLKSLGWRPKHSSEKAIRLTAKHLR